MIRVVAAGSPQLAHLAEVLAARHDLDAYIHPFLSARRPEDYARVPLIGQQLARLLARRAWPRWLDPERSQSAGARYDIAQALVARSRRLPLARRDQLSRLLMDLRGVALSRAAGRRKGDYDTIVAAYGTGLEAFVHARTATKLLDFPIAHFDFSRRMLAEEARLNPTFAPTLQFHTWPARTTERWSAEFKAADCVLVPSTFAEASFNDVPDRPSRLAVVPFGVDAAQFRPPPAKTEAVFNVMFVGQIGQRKGLSYLLEAYREFRRSDSRLTLVGDFVGDPSPVLARSELFDRRHHVPHGSLPAVLGEASVLVLPSLVEGLPLVVLEAMATGVPVIVTPPAGEDIVRNEVDGFLVPIRDPSAIASALRRLYDDSGARTRMGLKARERAVEFSWDRYADRVLAAARDTRGSAGSAAR